MMISSCGWEFIYGLGKKRLFSSIYLFVVWGNGHFFAFPRNFQKLLHQFFRIISNFYLPHINWSNSIIDNLSTLGMCKISKMRYHWSWKIEKTILLWHVVCNITFPNCNLQWKVRTNLSCNWPVLLSTGESIW